MSDSLVLKGLKDVRKHTGSEMLLQRPPRGGDAYPVKKWWATNASQTIYVGCSVFKVTAGGNDCFLAIDTAEMSTVRVDHDGSFNFSFFINKEVSRAALFTDDWQIIEHYVFPKISGGKVMTVIPAGAASKPGGTVPPTVGTVTVTGDSTALDSETKSYSAGISGTASTGISYSWTFTGDAAINGPTNQQSASFVLSSGSATITCEVSATGASDSPQSGDITVNIT